MEKELVEWLKCRELLYQHKALSSNSGPTRKNMECSHLLMSDSQMDRKREVSGEGCWPLNTP
jgi:hypothetical protein